jgi:acyl-homoserine lactone acylase PvdQ
VGRSASGHPIYVAGPQVGYSYPAFFLEVDLHRGGFDVRGVSFPGVPWIVIGRGPDYAWSATTSHSDIVDQYVETLCNGDDTHYVYRGQCLPMGSFDAGVVKGPPDRVLSFRTTVHGPVLGYAAVQGRRPRSPRNARRAAARSSAHSPWKTSTRGVRSAKEFLRVMNGVEFAFNRTYADDRDIAYFSSGRLPIRAASVNLGLPTNGKRLLRVAWLRAFQSAPAGVDSRGGFLTSWDNKAAAVRGRPTTTGRLDRCNASRC